jgi:hypothetical protein
VIRKDAAHQVLGDLSESPRCRNRRLERERARDRALPFASAHALYGLSKLAVWWLRLGKTQNWKRLRRPKHDHHPVYNAVGNAEALIRLFNGER